MTDINIILTILGVASGIGGALFYAFPALKKKGVDVENILKKIDVAITGAQAATATAKEIVPGNKALDILDIVEKYAKIGVTHAEQEYISSQLPADKRLETAKNDIYAVLKIAGIEKSDAIDTIINGVLESEVYSSKDPAAISTQENAVKNKDTITLQQQVSDLAAKNTQLEQANAELTTKITDIQNTAGVVPSAATTVAQ